MQSTYVMLVFVIMEKKDVLGFETIRFLTGISGSEIYFIEYILNSSIYGGTIKCSVLIFL